MDRPLDRETIAWFDTVEGRVTIGDARTGAARVVGEVRRLTFVPDGGEGRLEAVLCDGTGELLVVLPRRHVVDWTPGALVAVEGELTEQSVRALRELTAAAYAPIEVDDPAPLRWSRVTPDQVPEPVRTGARLTSVS
jgi:hypothetical protein